MGALLFLLAVTLGLFYLHAARRCGITLQGVDFPGHFLLRIETDEGPLAIPNAALLGAGVGRLRDPVVDGIVFPGSGTTSSPKSAAQDARGRHTLIG